MHSTSYKYNYSKLIIDRYSYKGYVQAVEGMGYLTILIFNLYVIHFTYLLYYKYEH